MTIENSIQKRVLTGVQPTGELTLGNYLGAIRKFVKLQDNYECLFMIADLHSLTTCFNSKELKQNIQNTIALLLACGVNPEKCSSYLFRQSKILAHGQLFSILNCHTQMGELKRMHQFKEKSGDKNEHIEINNGLFSYPTLMASDILLYQTDLVPVGIDQKQHLELTKVIANRFNKRYGKTFTIPQELLVSHATKIMSLQNPEKKMSKSDPNLSATIFLLDPSQKILKKINQAQTDSLNKVDYDPINQKGLVNLLHIGASITGNSPEKIALKYANNNYSSFKQSIAQLIIDLLEPIQKRYYEYITHPEYLHTICKGCEDKINLLAMDNLNKIYQKIGL